MANLEGDLRGRIKRGFTLAAHNLADAYGDPTNASIKSSKNNVIIDFDPENENRLDERDIMRIQLNDENAEFIPIEKHTNYNNATKEDLLNGFKDAVRKHIIETGAQIDTLVLHGHGASFKIGNEVLSQYIDLKDVLETLEELESEFENSFDGQAVFKEVVFDGCNTLDKVNAQTAQYMYDYTVNNDVSIVGTVSSAYYGDTPDINPETGEPTHFGRYIKIDKNGIDYDDRSDNNFPESIADWKIKQNNAIGWEGHYLNTDNFADGNVHHLQKEESLTDKSMEQDKEVALNSKIVNPRFF